MIDDGSGEMAREGRASSATLAGSSEHTIDLHAARTGAPVSGGASGSFDTASRFEDRYANPTLLGSGGMGDVFAFRDCRIGRTVAVKRLPAKRDATVDARSRFVREAMVQGQLEHPSIVPVYDVGIDSKGVEYFTMRRIRGETLASLIHDERAEPPARNKLLRIFTQLCLAVEYAHSRGVVHRDLKPENVMVGDFGEVYVLDWGIARLAGLEDLAEPIDQGPSQANATHVGRSMGTPGYMSPEQWDDAGRATASSDIYSLGAILFEILARARLHVSEPMLKVMYATTTGVDARPSARNAQLDIPPELDALCVRATAVAPADRCTSAREIADTIDAFLEGDRDASMRSTMAEQHRERAHAAADHALGDFDDADAHRAIALREAGRAIALDPGNAEAMRIAVRVMVTPPKRRPAEVEAELRRDEILGVRLRARFGSFALSCFLGIAGFALWLGVKNWLPFYGLVGFLSAGVVGVWLAFQRFVPDSAVANCVDVGTALAFVAISCSAGFVGPGLVVPALATALTTGAFVGALERRRGLIVVLGLLSFCVPYFAEWFGLITPVYTYGDQGIHIAETMTRLTELPARLGILTGGVAAIVFPIFVIWPALRAAAAYREQVVTQAWQFRQLLPSTDL
jgi:hypothetical protein